MRKTPVHVLAATILLVLLALSATPPVSGQQSNDTGAVLTPKQGLVQMRADDVPVYEWQTITDPTLVRETDWVQTDQAGLAEITFFDGNLVEILPNTQIQVAEYRFADENSPIVTIRESVGDVRHKIDRVLDAESKYEVDTPSAVLTVRGTNFFSAGYSRMARSDCRSPSRRINRFPSPLTAKSARPAPTIRPLTRRLRRSPRPRAGMPSVIRARRTPVSWTA
jgi:hypothetical protein